MSPVHRNTPEVSSIGRTVLLLREFLHPSARMTPEELTRRTGLPKTTIHRMVAELVRLGMLERVPNGLQLGTLVFELGQFAPRARNLREAARPVLADLSKATDQNVGLAVVDGSEVVYLDIIGGRDAPRLPQRGGMRWPAHASCSGKAVLAFAPPASVDRVLETGLRALTPQTITTVEEFRAELDDVRRKGAAYDRRESFENVAGVAAPVFDVEGQVVAAVSISGVAGRISLARFDVAVRASAAALTRALAAPAARAIPARGAPTRP